MLAVRKFSEILKWKGQTHKSVLDYISALPKERFQTQTCTVWNRQGTFTVIKIFPIDFSTSITLTTEKFAVFCLSFDLSSIILYFATIQRFCASEWH